VAYPLTPTPSLNNAEWEKFTKKLEANENKKVPKKEIERMDDLVRKVLANSKLK